MRGSDGCWSSYGRRYRSIDEVVPVWLRLALTWRISYSRETEFRAPQTTLPFKVLVGVGGL